MTSGNKDIKIAPGAVVCLESKLRGSITVGSMTVIHPKASIIAEGGPVIIGENNIIEEQAAIIHQTDEESKNENPVPLSIGVNNVFEVGCEIRAKSIGDHNVFESKCFVGPKVEIGNGCIIGAGCHITVQETLPDQTVITGKECIRSVALDRPPDPDDLARQHDELTVMSEIFTLEEFRIITTSSEKFAIFDAHIPLPKNFSLLLSSNTAQTEFKINHLPPVHLVVSLPQDYPSRLIPGFTLSSCWLSKTALEKLKKQLERHWEETHSEILYLWCSILTDQSLELLNISDSYDLREKLILDNNKSIQPRFNQNECKDVGKVTSCSSNISPNKKPIRRNNRYVYSKTMSNHSSVKKFGDENNFLRNKAKVKLTKQNSEQLYVSQIDALNKLYCYLIEYNASKSLEEFQRNMQDCNVCFSSVMGESCKQLSCGHVTCTDCLRRMFEVHIKHGSMESMVCAEEDCNLEISANLIKELVSQELYERFDRLMLNRTLDKISNMIYCPRTHCQYPVTTQEEDSLAVCPSCEHAFCIFCKRPYHGIEGCRLKSTEKKELIDAYQNADYEQKKELEKRYGKKQLTELVSAAQSELWMSENSKQCPCCHIHIEKNDGCNKMICRKCSANFCWTCVTRLSSLNPYLHFQDPKSKCFNLLFEPAYEEINSDEADSDEAESDEAEEPTDEDGDEVHIDDV